MKAKRKELLIALISGWICFIFLRSLKSGDISAQESRWALDMIEALLPFELSMQLIRKLAHFVEFAVLGLLSWALYGSRAARLWQRLLIFFLTTAFIALCDETIQLFIPGRASSVRDIWIDIFGALFGGAVAAALLLIRKSKIKNKT